jgi:O-antigen ligase
MNPVTSTRLADPLSGYVQNIGWLGPFNHKNNLAAFMVASMVVVLALEKNTARRRVAVASMLALVFLTRSGTGAGGMVATLVVFFTVRRYARQTARQGGMLAALAAMLGLVGVSVASVFLPSILQLYGKDLTFTNRTDIWAAVWPAIRARPWTGYSWGGVWLQPQTEPTGAILQRLGFAVFHAHNGAIEMILEIGLIGFGFYLCIFFATMDGGRRLLRSHPDVGAMIIAFGVFIVVSSFTEVLTLGPWLTALVLLRALSLRLLHETAAAGPSADGDELYGSRASRSAATSASAASAMARKGRPERFAMSTSERVPSDWFSTQSTPISTDRESIPPPIAE